MANQTLESPPAAVFAVLPVFDMNAELMAAAVDWMVAELAERDWDARIQIRVLPANDNLEL
jgi:hypothetical protein